MSSVGYDEKEIKEVMKDKRYDEEEIDKGLSDFDASEEISKHVALKNTNWEMNLVIGKKMAMVQKFKEEAVQVKNKMNVEWWEAKATKNFKFIEEIEILRQEKENLT